MKLKTIGLHNFRCFREATIDLSGDVVAIFGRNGAGKTALFDALEFALLGSIGRFSQEESTPDYLPCVFTQEDVRVRVDFDDASHSWIECQLKRAAEGNSQIDGSGSWKSHNGFLFDFLLDPDLSPSRREIDTASEYIRATILLSQMSVRNFIEAAPHSRATVLAYLAGVGAVQRRLEKAQKVLAEARRRKEAERGRLSEIEQIAEGLSLRCAEYDGSIVELRKTLGDEMMPLDSIVRALRAVDINIEPTALPKENLDTFAALIRSSCAERIRALETRLNLLAEIEGLSPLHSSRLQQRQSILQSVEQARARQETVLKEEDWAARRLLELERESNDLELCIATQRNHLAVLDQIRELHRRHAELESTLATADNERQQVQRELLLLMELLKQVDSDWDRIALDAGTFQRQGQDVLSRLLALTTLYQAVPDYPSVVQSIVNQIVRLHNFNCVVRSLTDRKADHEATFRTVEQRASELNSTVLGIKTSVEEVASLASRLREHATGIQCPLCGHEYASATALGTAIEMQLRREPDELQKASADYEALVQQKARLAAEIVASEQQLREQKTAIDNTRRERDEALNLLDTALERKNRTYEDARDSLILVDEQLRSLQTEDLSNLTPDDLQASIHTCQSQLADLESKRAALLKLTESVQIQWSSRHSERLAVEQNLLQWQESFVRLTADIQSYQTKCSQFGLDENTAAGEITSTRRQVSEEMGAVQLALTMTDRYALGCKIASAEGERSQIRSLLEDAENNRAKARKQIEELSEAGQEVEGWIKSLSEYVGRAVAERITEHKVEVTNLFKAMIPTPYLFEEIAMNQVNDGLSLGLRYRGQEVDAGEPRFFLSNAQANVLALSVFLSFTRAQRWARLETILLDDPVQHLDDLDAVAFLDILRSIALGGLGPRKQVIVSTCDRDLYQLMIRKFGLLENTGLRITGISLLDRGEAGPEIYYDIGGLSGRKYLREVG
jgi:DNA repair exonuclease SbcCD ATPase subunit